MREPAGVPFFRPSITEAEVSAVTEVLRSGWLTTGARTREFEERFARYVGAAHAVAVNSCTAALHLALEAIGLRRGDLAILPTFTFAATAEVVRYFDAVPVLVDVDRATLCIDPDAVEEVLDAIEAGTLPPGVPASHGGVRALISVHYGGQMADVDRLRAIAERRGLAYIEDAAHALPARSRASADSPWRSVGTTADVTCFSFYANKCITTGEGGMATTDDPKLAERMRIMSLHGLSRDAWRRFETGASYYYEIVAPGFKYNLTDIAAAIGVCQLERADQLWKERARVAARYRVALGDIPEIELPLELPDRQHSWHLFPIRLSKDSPIARDDLIGEMARSGVGSSVHWMPLHLHPYYRQTFGHRSGTYPVAEEVWPRLVSLPLFPDMRDEEIERVATVLRAAIVR
jgi:dTDP-4-amino-4,6-dideoxygalactose transaminase